MRQQCHLEHDLQKPALEISDDREQVAALGDAAPSWRDAGKHGKESWRRDRRQDKQSPDPRGGQRNRPAHQQRQEGSWRRERSPQIVDHLPATEQRDGGLPPVGHGRSPVAHNPRQQLPITARPAMLAGGNDVIARWKFLYELDVGG